MKETTSTVLNPRGSGGWALDAPSKQRKGWIVLGVSLIACILFCLHLKLRYLVVFDSVNFALALRRFDVTVNQPHAPGYPGYVLLTRLLHRALPDPTAVFFAAGILATAVTTYLLTRLGDAMENAKAGVAAAVLLIFNTSNTSSIIISSVRNYLAVTSALIAWLAWLTATRERPRSFFFLSVICLGLFSSFRPESLVTLLPLVLWASVQRKLHFRDYCIAAALCAAAILVWLIPTARPAGGLLSYINFVHDFFADQARGAAELNRHFSSYPLLYMTWKSAVWAFLSVLTWIWVVPFTWKRQHWIPQKRTLWFLAVWLLPGFVFSSVVHINSSGHALATVTAVCMIGGLIVASIRSELLFVTALVLASLGNFYIFEHPIIPFDDASVVHIKYIDRYLGQMTEELLGLRHFKQLFLVTDNSSLSWRTIHYYLPDTPLLDIAEDHSGAMLLRGEQRPVRLGPKDTAKLPPCGIIAWIVNNPQGNLIPQIPSAIVPGWHGLVTLTRISPGLHLTVSGIRLESENATCPQPAF